MLRYAVTTAAAPAQRGAASVGGAGSGWSDADAPELGATPRTVSVSPWLSSGATLRAGRMPAAATMTIRKIAASKDYTDFMAGRGFGVMYAGPDDFAKFMAKSDADLGATMKAVGIAK